MRVGSEYELLFTWYVLCAIAMELTAQIPRAMPPRIAVKRPFNLIELITGVLVADPDKCVRRAVVPISQIMEY